MVDTVRGRTQKVSPVATALEESAHRTNCSKLTWEQLSSKVNYRDWLVEGRASNTSSPTPPTHYKQFVFGSPKTKQSGEITSMMRPLKGETENITLMQVTWPVCRVCRTSKRRGGGNKAIKRQRCLSWQRIFLKSSDHTAERQSSIPLL